MIIDNGNGTYTRTGLPQKARDLLAKIEEEQAMRNRYPDPIEYLKALDEKRKKEKNMTATCYEHPGFPLPCQHCTPKTSNPARVSDGSTAKYYELPSNAKEIQDLISYRNMNAQMGEIFRACYRYGQVAHSPKARDLKKIIFYAKAELARLEKYECEE